MAERSPFEPLGDWVDGAFALPAHTSGEIALECPSDLERLRGAFPFALESVGAAVAAARAAWPAWRDAPAAQRALCLEQFAAELRREREPLAELIALEVGKPRWEALGEVDAMLAKVEITLGQGLELVAERSFDAGPGQTARWRNPARGVLAVLGPFNFPGHLVNGHVVPALATGNCVVIKPSEKAPAVGQAYAQLLQRAGFPRGVANLVQGDGALGAALAAHADVDGVLFTGSWSVGRALLAATLDQPWKLVALEMGGKNAVLVCDDADLDASANAIAFGACATAGQRCSATSRVFAQPRIADALVAKLARLLRELRVGDPLDPGVFMGPLISSTARQRHALVQHWARCEGAEPVVVGGPCDGPRRGHWVRPSLHRVARLDPASRYQREEHFAPDLFVHEVDSLDSAILAIDACDYGLVASVFSADRAKYERVARAARVGVVNWNAPTVGASSKLPFGGLKRSGNGRPAGATATLYCTYPLASLEIPAPRPGRWPGLPEPA
jgi:succinylglutamic semialdehyde dehydrogenase